ncbi:TRIO and F-actin-binding protein isoform X2 [Rhinatrema bivittatum]|uniref:TRIO and F-actin-binding protein isoform X2 n=1 Tax=Rhinatrema bivittatum TaxID=194408 RepID=UPI001128B22A|nr:TRIO and F-actin-binding protein isoform X2 [Rhinatrema bivittatum]
MEEREKSGSCAGGRRWPDLLNFKKGWMSLLDDQKEWKKRWFVLTDSSLRYYRDSNAEEADDLDGEIDLRSCLDVTEFAVQRNYGFQIHTKEAVFTLSAMTSGIRRNWIEALRKNVRPTSAPDVTKLSDSNKENSFRSYSSQKVMVRSEEQCLGPVSEVITQNANKKLEAANLRQTPFSYVELAPLHQGPLSQENSLRPRAALRAPDNLSKADELEREQGLRSEERRKWFEGPVPGGTRQDEAWSDLLRKVGDRPSLNSSLSVEQRQKLAEEIERKWLELERLPLRESKQIPLTALLGQGKGSLRTTSESKELFEKEIQTLKAQLESAQQELNSYRTHNGRVHEQVKSRKEAHVPRGYISQEACERSLVEMESSHQQAMAELQRHHQRELERLRQEKEELLAEETAATVAAIEAMRKAHKEELQRELEKAQNFPKGGSSSSSQEAFRRQHQSDVESLKRDLQALSERYSQKCLEINALTQTAEERDRTLLRCQQEGRELLRQNQELNSRLSEEIEKLRSFMAQHRADGDVLSQNSGRSSYELEVLLRVKEKELQYLKQQVGCLREEIQTMQNDKRYASNKYNDIYVELNNIKTRSEREIEQLKEHLRLAMAALQEEATVRNSIE